MYVHPLVLGVFFHEDPFSLLGMIPAQIYWQISYRLTSVAVTIPFLVWPSEVEFLISTVPRLMAISFLGMQFVLRQLPMNNKRATQKMSSLPLTSDTDWF